MIDPKRFRIDDETDDEEDKDDEGEEVGAAVERGLLKTRGLRAMRATTNMNRILRLMGELQIEMEEFKTGHAVLKAKANAWDRLQDSVKRIEREEAASGGDGQ